MQEGPGGGYSRKATLLFLIHCIDPAFCSNHFSLHPKKLSFACIWAKKGKMGIACAEFLIAGFTLCGLFLFTTAGFDSQALEREARRKRGEKRDDLPLSGRRRGLINGAKSCSKQEGDGVISFVGRNFAASWVLHRQKHREHWHRYPPPPHTDCTSSWNDD